MKKKIFAIIISAILSIALLAGCATNQDSNNSSSLEDNNNNVSSSEGNGDASSSENEEKTVIKIGATPSPHAEILEKANEILEKEGYTLDIIEFTDYVQPNLAVDSGELDANYFQHQPYLDAFNEERGTDIVSVASIHYEPLGIYGGKTASLDELKDGATVAVPNDTTNEARALLLLEAQGLIKLKEDAGLKATVNDIVENPKKLEIIEIEAAQIPHSLQDVDIAVINGNYAIEAGLKVKTDALATEDADSIGATTYGNVVAVKKGNENNEAIQALVKALKSDEIKQYMEETYEGAVVPLFE
jgi:D-methionine transport system substrate-binding protein